MYRAGEVLVPGDPTDDIVLVDSRDVAQYALARIPGAVEITAPVGRDHRGDLMAACLAAAGSEAELTWVESDWLAAQDVTPWTEVPLWIPPGQAPGVFRPRPPAAMGARPLVETVADTWAWQRSRPWRPTEMTPGLAPDRERDLLAAWHAR